MIEMPPPSHRFFFYFLSPIHLPSLSEQQHIRFVFFPLVLSLSLCTHRNVDLCGMSNVIHIMSNQEASHSPSPPLIRASTPVPQDRSFLSNLTFYAVRRHHSAPQQDCLWQQVEIIICLSFFF